MIAIDDSVKDACGVYVHIALCRSKCIYCDFYSSVLRRDFDWHVYLDCLVKELRSRADELKGRRRITLYIGGGTPSLIPENLFAGFMNTLREVIYNASPQAEIVETTMEVNPDDVNQQRVLIWKSAGIDRISMGIQSLDDHELQTIGRRHDADGAIRAYSLLKEHFSNISIDLMFGLPGQTLESLRKTLEGFISMHPSHISAYSLMYEERTVLTRMRDSGRIKEADENLSVDMFSMINSMLRDAGYVRYEISNYSLPGFESKHNSSYWNGTPYVGIGPSAHSYDGNKTRRWNSADLDAYINGVKKSDVYSESEILSETELYEECVMTSIRKSMGIELKNIRERFGQEAAVRLIGKARNSIEKGLLEMKEDRIFLTDDGIMVSDEIIVELF